VEKVIANRYELEDLLGSGAMSEVWSATDRKLERRVALKLLAPRADTDRFQREAHAVASLAHPNIVQLYDYGEDGGRPYMVLELLPGGTLADRLARAQPLRDADTRLIARSIAAGLGHAHSVGIVHRDLKPANVLFDDEGRAKLADFGIARLAVGTGTVTEAGTLLGTAAYMSPEQAAGEPAGPASDVYSFGVILYQMLTGRLPFESADPFELVALHRTAAPPPLSLYRTDVPTDLDATVTAALAKNPAERPADGTALLAALGGAEAAVPVAAAPPPPPSDAELTLERPSPPPPAPPPGRSRVPQTAAALLVLALAGAGLAYTVSRPAKSSPGEATLPRQTQKPKDRPGRTPVTPTVASATSTTERSTSTATTREATTQPTTPPATTQPSARTTTARTTTARTTEPSATTTTDTTTESTTTAPTTTGETTATTTTAGPSAG
jgi:serine/threonine-protein kinase